MSSRNASAAMDRRMRLQNLSDKSLWHPQAPTLVSRKALKTALLAPLLVPSRLHRELFLDLSDSFWKGFSQKFVLWRF